MLNSLGSGLKLARVFLKVFGAVGFSWVNLPVDLGWGSDTLWAGLGPDGYREGGKCGLRNVCCCRGGSCLILISFIS